MKQRIISMVILLIIMITLILPFVQKTNNISNNTIKDEIVFLPTLNDERIENITQPTIEEDTESTVEVGTKPIVTRPKIYEVFDLNEIYLIQRCVETECYTADIKSKTNVACVIFNRFKDGRFGNTITEIITRPNQFSYFRTEISQTTIQAVEDAWKQDITQGALYFHSSSYNGRFEFATFLFKDGIGHHFYK